MLNSCQLTLRDEEGSKVSLGVMSSDKKQGLTEKFHYQYLPSSWHEDCTTSTNASSILRIYSLVNTVVT